MVKPASQNLSGRRSNAPHEPHKRVPASVDPVDRNQHEKSFAASADVLNEVAQAKIRNWMHIVLIGLASVAARFDPTIDSTKLLATAIVGLPAGAALYYWAIQLNDKKSHHIWRISQRVTSMLSDTFFITWVLYFGGVTFAGMFALYIWISVGYGIRYGLNYLFAELGLSVVGFGIAAWFTPFWHDNPGLVGGMLFGLIIVPVYTGWLIAQLQKAVAEKDMAYRAKSDFVAMMSHELRTPLHGIISTSDLLRGTATSPKQKEMIRIISTSSNSLLELINRVLDISKFESNSIALQQQPMDLHEVVNDTANILWPQALEKGLSLQVYIDPEIHNSLIGAPHQLQEVLMNLCGNAVKFTDTGQVAIRVLFKGETEESVSVRFEISDTGPGIPKHALATIFEPFVQSDSPTTRKHGGTGLGTAFAKELTRLMGGNINVESTEGVGTKFTIDVDLLKLHERDEVAPLYPYTVAGIGFDPSDQELTEALSQFGTKIDYFDSASELSDFSASDRQGTYPDAIFVNANEFADNLAGIVRTVSATMSERIIPMFACGNDAYKSSAISSGYSTYISRLDNGALIGRTLNMISALRHDSVEQLSPAANRTRRLHILVAEDNPTNQRIAQMVLEEVGHRCTIVSNGDEALDALHEGGYDLAILDMHMPNRDGIEVAKIYNFSHFDEADRIPLIMMTADSRLEARDEAYASGVDAFVTKPITPKQLVEVIESIAAKNKIRGDLDGVSDGRQDDFSRAAGPSVQTPRTSGISSNMLNMATVDELISYMDGEESRTFFEDFIADGSSYLASLIDCDDLDKAQTAKDKMHAFAGACLVIGADKLAEKARRIEMTGSTTILSGYTELHDDLLATFTQTAEGLRELYSDPPA